MIASVFNGMFNGMTNLIRSKKLILLKNYCAALFYPIDHYNNANYIEQYKNFLSNDHIQKKKHSRNNTRKTYCVEIYADVLQIAINSIRINFHYRAWLGQNGHSIILFSFM